MQHTVVSADVYGRFSFTVDSQEILVRLILVDDVVIVCRCRNGNRCGIDDISQFPDLAVDGSRSCSGHVCTAYVIDKVAHPIVVGSPPQIVPGICSSGIHDPQIRFDGIRISRIKGNHFTIGIVINVCINTLIQLLVIVGIDKGKNTPGIRISPSQNLTHFPDGIDILEPQCFIDIITRVALSTTVQGMLVEIMVRVAVDHGIGSGGI